MRRHLFLLVVLVSFIAGLAPAQAAYEPGRVLFTFTDPQITESSGLTRSTLNDGIFFTHNDSGDNGNLGRFFAVNTSGATVTEFALTPTGNADWEDMSTGTGSDGEPALFFADIGDNYEFRTAVQIYEVPEPKIVPGVPFAELRPTRMHLLVFEDGPHNAETFLVDPRDGSMAIVTKHPSGNSGIYVADLLGPSGAPRLLRRTATIRFDQLGSVATNAAREATGGDIAGDRSRLVVRTYLEAFEWQLGDRTLAEAVAQPPTRLALPTSRQGEAIAYSQDGASILTSSEGTYAPVHILEGL